MEFQPGKDPNEEKRIFWVIAISMGLLYVWTQFFAPKPPTPQNPPSVAQAPQTPTSLSPTTPKASPAPSTDAQETSPALVVSQTTPQTPLAEGLLSSKDFKGTWTNQGGTIDHLELTDFFQSLDEDSPPIEVWPFKDDVSSTLHWQIAINSKTYDDANWRYQVLGSSTSHVTFSHEVQEGVFIEKDVRLGEDHQIIETLTLKNTSKNPIQFGAQALLAASEAKKPKKGLLPFMGTPVEPLKSLSYINEEVHRFDREEIVEDKPTLPSGDIAWGGFDDQYFLLALSSEGKARIQDTQVTPAENGGIVLTFDFGDGVVAASDQLFLKTSLYAGPKDIGQLNQAQPGLEKAINFGSILGLPLGWLSRALLHSLRWLYMWVGNYGLAIVLLTVGVRLLIFPLAHMQARSMKKMQEHKPALDALKERYADDREAHSRAMLQYMRTHKINPMGGCLLILPQMPFFFALYRVLYTSIELRHAPFVGWIQDLSAYDPYFVLAVLVAGTMFLQMKMNPAPGADPNAMKMMKIMPIIFGAFSLFLPAGLNLYLFVSILWGIVQQYFVQGKRIQAQPVVMKTGGNQK